MAELHFTKRALENLEPADRDVFYWDDDTHGFGLKITPAGRRSYVYQYRLGGRTRRYTIGPMRSHTHARVIAEKLEAAVKDGIDPVAELKASRDAAVLDSVSDVASTFIKRHVSHNRSKCQFSP